MPTPVIEVSGLTKSYGSNHVLKGVSFEVQPGQIFAMLGPNGAGKTTTISILTTLVRPDSGSIRIASTDVLADPKQARRHISLTGQFASVDAFQTGRENLAMMCRLAHLNRRETARRSAELLEQFGLVDAANRRVAQYSGGMRRRLDLAISLIARPPVVFLDEPTTGLDPRSRVQLWSIVRELAGSGTTIVLTTQYLDEADQLADRIAVLDEGTIVAEGTAPELKSRVAGQRVEFTLQDARSYALARTLVTPTSENPELLTVSVDAPAPMTVIADMLALAAEHDIVVADVNVVKPTLDEVFLALTGRSATSGNANGRANTTTNANGHTNTDAREPEQVAA
ncbi:ATP-binding cassette domain-containing protein [Subtercola lobariae]|uniref:Daunorubicin resistance protein DrrA family ABC transporter ATP-binding protein n=1 Tax=Subtercola lobariae TaxID=1588641 RepID=A0A917EXQ3_9MICO|nr:ATP-binding cassette domain-containing protein [Subtercola lobariae]GGF29564.1 daunorubicin resistance protein DrrA family ABC transporter ATP-binding protein [Subtercola lobariae]